MSFSGKTTAMVHRLPRGLLLVLLALGFFAVFTPLSPGFPQAGLDASWVLVLNQAVAQGLLFGRDIVFTYGPYAALVTHAYHPATDVLMLWSGALLGTAYVAMLLLLARGTRSRWLLAYLIFALGCVVAPDPLFASYPLLLALLCYRINLPAGALRGIALTPAVRAGVLLLFLPFGLLVLAKGTFLITCSLLALLCAGLFWRSGERWLAGAALAVPALAIPLFWVLSGQPLSALPGFFGALGPIISGYSLAMVRYGRDGHAHTIVLYLIAAICLLCWARGGPGRRSTHTLFLAAVYAVFLFFAFKAGFVRHDAHAVIAGDALMLAWLLTYFVADEPPTVGVALLCLLVFWACDEYAVGSSTRTVYHNLSSTFSGLGKGLRARQHPQALTGSYADALAQIQSQQPFLKRPGTMDIYPYDEAYVFSSGNAWSPRPVFQSYSAYTPELLERNAAHLLGASAPDNILFKLDPMNNRLPALEDGLSWPILINRYSLQGFENNFIYFHKRAVAVESAPQSIGSGGFQLGDEVVVPASGGPLFAQIDIHQSAYGTIESALFRAAQLHISVHLADGRVLDYGFVPGMAKTSFLLSPLMEDSAGFCRFALGDAAGLASNQVKSFRIYAPGIGRLSWQGHYTVNWEQQALVRDAGPGLLPGCATLQRSDLDKTLDPTDKDRKQ